MNKQLARQLEREVREAERDLVVVKKYGDYPTYEFYRNKTNELRKKYIKEVFRE